MNCIMCSNKLEGYQRCYCSQSCKNKAYRIKAADDYRNRLEDKSCAYQDCNTPFAARKGKKYCSIRCSALNRQITKEVTNKRKLASFKKDKVAAPKYHGSDDSWLNA